MDSMGTIVFATGLQSRAMEELAISQVRQDALHPERWAGKNLDPQVVQGLRHGCHGGLGQDNDIDTPWVRAHCCNNCFEIGGTITALEVRPRFTNEEVLEFHVGSQGGGRLLDQLRGGNERALECGHDQYARAELDGSIGHGAVNPRSCEASAR